MAEETDNEEEQCEKLQGAFDAERAEWNVRMEALIPMLRNADQLVEAQVLMLSHRHKLVDTMSRYRNAFAARKSKDVVYKRIQIGKYKEAQQRRLTDRELGEALNADLAFRSRKTSILQNQIEYMEQTVDTLDKMGFAVRNRIEIENIQSGRL